MLVRMCSIMAGPVYGNARYGDILSLPTGVGEEMIARRHAEAYVEETPKPKKAKVKRGRGFGRNDTTGD